MTGETRNLSADIYCDFTGKKWSASISEHPRPDGAGTVIWEKHGMRSKHNAVTAMEATWKSFKEPTP